MCDEEVSLEAASYTGGCGLAAQSVRASLHVHNQPLPTDCIGPQNTLHTFLLKKAPSSSTDLKSKSER